MSKVNWENYTIQFENGSVHKIGYSDKRLFDYEKEKLQVNAESNIPVTIPQLSGSNTVFCDKGNISVEYRKSPTAEQLITDIIAPTQNWLSPVSISQDFNLKIANKNNVVQSQVNVSNQLARVNDVMDYLQIKNNQVLLFEKIDKTLLNPTTTDQTTAIMATPVTTDITNTQTGQALLAIRTVPYHTRIYVDSVNPLPTIEANIKQF